MKNPRTLCREHNIYEYRAIKAAELMAQAIADDLNAMLLHDTTRPLHERVAEYLKMK